ncbi:MAG: gliding motility-associated C-terminal domain-containing protein [Bacteroidota bacterium]
MLRYLVLLLLLFGMNIFVPISYAQKQGNIWYFGDGAGLDFNSGVPVALTDGQTYFADFHNEGTAVISDSSGSLLFYSNGEKVWNRYHQVMPNGNGLLGHLSSTHAAFIVPKPGSEILFYLFTSDSYYQNDLKNGFRYSIINMCLDNGQGDIVPGTKNILLLDTVAEKISAIKHANNIDYWVITHKYFSDAFYAFLLTSNGIEDTVITYIGSVHEENCIPPSPNLTRAAIGQIKASPDGTKLALVNTNTCTNISELFDFDKSTGIVSNIIDLNTNDEGWYGLTFSPDNTKLYKTHLSETRIIYQYDLSAGGGHPDSIINSENLISFMSTGGVGAAHSLQIGPDGKIYVARGDKNFIAVINNPNFYGAACNFEDSAVYLNGKICSYGLPNFIDNYDYSSTGVTLPPIANITGPASICSGDSVELISGIAASYVWLFNGLPIIPGTTQTIIASSAGDYQVAAINDCGADTSAIKTITVDPLPDADAGNDTAIISGSSVQLSGSGGIVYSWSPSAGLSDPNISNPLASPTETTIYYLTVTDTNECSDTDSVIITVMDSVIIPVPDELDIFIPDIFSPNGDGENDVLYVYGKAIENILFVVYDRWGEKVYEAKEVTNGQDGEVIAGWNGTFDNKPLDPAVFVYYLEVNDGAIIKKGNITLIR